MYRRRRREYVAATNALVAWLQSRLEDVDEIEAFVPGRAEDVRSVEQKLRARIGCSRRSSSPTSRPGRRARGGPAGDEIASVAEGLPRLLSVDKDVDARNERSREETPGYRGRHFDVRARPDSELPELLTIQRAEIGRGGPGRRPLGLARARAAVQGRRRAAPRRSRQFVLAASLLELAERELEDLRAWQVDAQAHSSARPPRRPRGRRTPG